MACRLRNTCQTIKNWYGLLLYGMLFTSRWANGIVSKCCKETLTEFTFASSLLFHYKDSLL